MKNDRKKKTEYLFRQIGEIDDRYLNEALSYRPRKAVSRILTVAACLTLCCMLLLTLPLIARLTGNKSDSESPPPSVGDSGYDAVGEAQLAQDRLLLSIREDLADATVTDKEITVVRSAREIAFFSQSVHVVWSYGDDSAIYVSPALSEDQFTRLSQTITSGTRVDADRNQPVCKIWITLGNGKVITPYLQQSSGNTGACELFDYNAELLPSSEFSSCLAEILQ